MTTVAFTVPAVPVAQPRPRAVSIRNGADEIVGSRIVSTFRQHKATGFKESVLLCMQAAYKGAPLDGALGLSIVFIFPRPKAKIWKTKSMPREWLCGSRNDFDNLAKGVCDVLNKRLWCDDGQISDARVRRFVAAGDEAPHCEVKVWQLKPYAPEQQTLGGVV